MAESDHKFIQLFPNQKLKFSLNLVEFTTLKTLPHDFFDVFSISSVDLVTGVNIGTNGSHGKLTYKFQGMESKLDYSLGSKIDLARAHRLPLIGGQIQRMKLESVNFKLNKDIFNTNQNQFEVQVKRKQM